MIRCVVFDFDGTLVDSNSIKRDGFIEVAERFDNGPYVMKTILQQENAGDRYSIFKQFSASLNGHAEAGELAECYTQLCEERIVAAPEIPGTTRALAEFHKQDKLLFVNSATPSQHLVRLIRLRGMERWFNGVYGAPQNKSENLWHILGVTGTQPDELLMVGDGECDRAAAEVVRCHFVALENSENDFRQQPLYSIKDLLDLSEYVKGLS